MELYVGYFHHPIVSITQRNLEIALSNAPSPNGDGNIGIYSILAR
jgi:hypothetical protein